MANERRRHPRFRLGSIELNGEMTQSSEVTILDIGMGGVSLKADQRLNIGAKYNLKLRGRDKVFSVTCEVAWARLSGKRVSDSGDSVPVYTAGMRFVGLPDDAASYLGSLFEAGSEDPEPEDDRRQYSRHQPAGIALLDFPAGYSVDTISLSGMLVLSGAAVESESRVPMALFLDGGERVDLLGRVVSCRVAHQKGNIHFRIAIEFVELPDAARAALAAFLVSLPPDTLEASA